MSRRFVFLSEAMCLQGKYKYEEKINTFFHLAKLERARYFTITVLKSNAITAWKLNMEIWRSHGCVRGVWNRTIWSNSVIPWKKCNVERKWFSFSQRYSYTYFIQTPDHTCLWCKIANNAGICTCLISQQEDNKFPFYPRCGFCSMLIYYSN